MRIATRVAAGAALLVCVASAGVAAAASITEAIDNSNRLESNRERDSERKPEQVLAFAGLEAGDVVLDWGAGGGYWSELFSGVVGAEGTVYAQQTAGPRFDSREAAFREQIAPFGNLQLLLMQGGEPIPLDDDSVDVVWLSYLYHHMHYAEGSGETLPESTAGIIAQYVRVLKPGGTFILIEHAAADGSSRAQSASWHRTPPETAKLDFTGAGLEFVEDAPEIFFNPDDDLMNSWGASGLRGNTTSLVQKYRLPE